MALLSNLSKKTLKAIVMKPRKRNDILQKDVILFTAVIVPVLFISMLLINKSNKIAEKESVLLYQFKENNQYKFYTLIEQENNFYYKTILNSVLSKFNDQKSKDEAKTITKALIKQYAESAIKTQGLDTQMWGVALTKVNANYIQAAEQKAEATHSKQLSEIINSNIKIGKSPDLNDATLYKLMVNNVVSGYFFKEWTTLINNKENNKITSLTPNLISAAVNKDVETNDTSSIKNQTSFNTENIMHNKFKEDYEQINLLESQYLTFKNQRDELIKEKDDIDNKIQKQILSIHEIEDEIKDLKQKLNKQNKTDNPKN